MNPLFRRSSFFASALLIAALTIPATLYLNGCASGSGANSTLQAFNAAAVTRGEQDIQTAIGGASGAVAAQLTASLEGNGTIDPSVLGSAAGVGAITALVKLDIARATSSAKRAEVHAWLVAIQHHRVRPEAYLAWRRLRPDILVPKLQLGNALRREAPLPMEGVSLGPVPSGASYRLAQGVAPLPIVIRHSDFVITSSVTRAEYLLTNPIPIDWNPILEPAPPSSSFHYELPSFLRDRGFPEPMIRAIDSYRPQPLLVDR